MSTIERTPPVDIGHDVTVSLRRIDGELDAIEYTHTCRGEPNKPDSVAVKPAWNNGWAVLSVEPLTLSPSLLCLVCGHHGFVREGKWVPC